MFMFSVLDPTCQNQVTYETFTALMRERGFECTELELNEIFCCADVDAGGTISKEEAIFMELESHVREQETFKTKLNRRDQYQRFMAWAYIEDGRRGFPATHRLARRPWL